MTDVYQFGAGGTPSWMLPGGSYGEPGLSPYIARPTPTASAPNAGWAVASGVFAQLAQAYAAFHQTRMAAYEARAQASAFGYRATMLALDRRAAERRAESILEQGQSEVGNLTLEGGQRRAFLATSLAARGVEAGVGSAGEAMASEKLIQDVDVYNLTLGYVRAANAARAGAVALQNEARFARASSRNLRRSARAAAPEAQLAMGIANAALTGYGIGSYQRR